MNITKRSTAISFGMAAILAAIVIPFMPSNSFATEVTEVDDATVGRAIGGTINFPSNGTSSIQKAFGDAVNGDGSKSSNQPKPNPPRPVSAQNHGDSEHHTRFFL